jgi:ferredoxin
MCRVTLLDAQTLNWEEVHAERSLEKAKLHAYVDLLIQAEAISK